MPLSEQYRSRRAFPEAFRYCYTNGTRSSWGSLLGWVAGIENARTDYVLHFDADILLHQEPGYCWIEAGMKLLAKDPTVIFVAPYPGPPHKDGPLGQSDDMTIDLMAISSLRFFQAEDFSSVRQNLKRSCRSGRLTSPGSGGLLMQFGMGDALLPWEEYITRLLRKSAFWSADLGCPSAWAVHCPDHNANWVRRCPHREAN